MTFAGRAVRYVSRHGAVAVDTITPRSVHQRQRQATLAALAGVTFTSVTFVCQGNINRSALADHALRGLLGDAGPRIGSCGLHLRADRPSPPASIAVAATLGVDLSTHRSRTARDLAPEGTLLVGFEPHHLRAWTGGEHTEVAAVLLGDFSPDPGDRRLIPDPYGHDDRYTARVFTQVLRCVTELAGRIVPAGAQAWSVRA